MGRKTPIAGLTRGAPGGRGWRAGESLLAVRGSALIVLGIGGKGDDHSCS